MDSLAFIKSPGDSVEDWHDPCIAVWRLRLDEFDL